MRQYFYFNVGGLHMFRKNMSCIRANHFARYIISQVPLWWMRVLFFFIILGCNSDFTIEQCGQMGEEFYGCETTSSTPAPPPPVSNIFSRVYLWTTSTSSTGNIGGVGMANNRCVTGSSSAGLPSGTYTHEAVISTNTQNARNIIDGTSGPLRRTDNVLITNSWDDFFDPMVTLSNSIESSVTYVWMGINANGGPGNMHCNSWSSTSGRGLIGSLSRTDTNRFSFVDFACTTALSLLCVSYGN